MKAKHFIENREIYENIQITAIIRFERPGPDQMFRIFSKPVWLLVALSIECTFSFPNSLCQNLRR